MAIYGEGITTSLYLELFMIENLRARRAAALMHLYALVTGPGAGDPGCNAT